MRMDSRYIALLGKIINKYGVMSDLLDYTDNERELLRQAKTEYDFYHAHERLEAPIVEQESRLDPAVPRAKLRLKATG